MIKTSYIDHHAHVYGTGYKSLHPKLDHTNSIDEVLTVIKPILSKLQPEQWVVARGWDQNKWQEKHFPTYESLDALSATIPIVLIRIDGHALWCNSKALELAKISKDTPIPSGGDILRSASGTLTGIILDDAMQIIYDAMPKEHSHSIKQTLLAGLQEFAKHHIGVHDMGIPAEYWEPYKELYSTNGDILPRAYVFLDMSKPTGRTLFFERLQDEIFDDSTHKNLKLVGIKLYFDGALGSRGAHLFKPYSDDTNNYGLKLTDDTDAIELMSLAAERGLQIAIHAIGDAANSRALDLIEIVKHQKTTSVNTIFRIEHAQIIREEDLERYRRLNVWAIIQPQFYQSDHQWAIERLGAERIGNAYRWKSLLEAGISVLASSDSPVEEANPYTGINLLQSRSDEKVSFEEAEKMYLESPLD